VRRCSRAGDVQTAASGKTFVGTGNPEACVDLLREHVVYKAKDASRCQQHQCAIGAVYQPPLPDHLQFYAIGAFAYTVPSIGALIDDAVFVPAIGYQKAFEFCELVIHLCRAMTAAAAASDDDDDDYHYRPPMRRGNAFDSICLFLCVCLSVMF